MSKNTQNKMLFYPVCSILDQALDLTEYALPKGEVEESINWGLSENINLKIECDKVKDVACIDGINQIWLYENFCQFLWAFNYAILTIQDSHNIKNGIAMDSEISKDQADELYSEAKVMFGYALLLLEFNSEDREKIRAFREKWYEFPNPVTKKNRYTELANEITIGGISYLLLHEYGHYINEHEESTPKTESEADDHSFRRLIEWGKKFTTDDKPIDNVVLIGAMTAIAATAFMNPTFACQTHPDIDDRIVSLFESYKAITGSEIIDTTFYILILALRLWAYANKMNLPTENKDESYKDYLLRIKEEFIFPIKKSKNLM